MKWLLASRSVYESAFGLGATRVWQRRHLLLTRLDDNLKGPFALEELVAFFGFETKH